MGQMNHGQEHKPDLIAGSILFSLFITLLLALMLLSGWGYGRISQRMEQTYGQRTVLSYVAGQIRRHDQAGSVSVGEYENTTALTLCETIEGEKYKTLIYCVDDSVYELFIREGDVVPLESGTKMFESVELTFRKEGELVQIGVRSGGRESSLELTLRSETRVL